ncbi:hypothetical protein Harman_41760 [Haloarcula mannanilytica]|uniref:Uncharacterized protein n=1 Tax=Haloarcula mannanilytica TaxID=2509225 RepID=A0A4C2ENY3_9EURY|nr:hypothetical protein [Haloarcula mannanilytica]GCF16241.1 hypothetical protein Harman_41760 [Haloarcula mannanilytica]
MSEYAETKRYVENRKPSWLFVDAARSSELKYGLFNYFPEAHYSKAVDQALKEEVEDRLETDGGRRTQYYWVGDEGVLYHTQRQEDVVVPFFDTVRDAERFLESQADRYGEDRYTGMVLRKTGNQKVEEAVEVLTSQSGLEDFAPDGGQTGFEDLLKTVENSEEADW